MGQVNIDQQASGYIPFGADSETQLRHVKQIRIGSRTKSVNPAETPGR